MNETQQTIALWGRETFGGFSALSMVVRANIEMAELISAIECGADPEKVALEVADVDIVLCQMAEILGINVQVEKMHVTNAGRPVLDQAISANTEMSHLIARVRDGSQFALMSLAAIYRDLLDLSFSLGFDLQEVRNEKMRINRARKWGKTENGHFQHL